MGGLFGKKSKGDGGAAKEARRQAQLQAAQEAQRKKDAEDARRAEMRKDISNRRRQQLTVQEDDTSLDSKNTNGKLKRRTLLNGEQV